MGHIFAFAIYLSILYLLFQFLFKRGDVTSQHFKSLVPYILIGVLFTSLFLVFYQSFQREIPFWDSVVYWKKSMEISDGLLNDMNNTFHRVYMSLLYDDYTDLPALLISPGIFLFGKSYNSFLLSINLLLIAPVQLLAMFLIRDILKTKGFQFNTRANVLLFLLLISPFFYIATIRGYLDCIGLLFVLYFLRYAFDQDYSKFDLRTSLCTSVLLVVFIFTRRWYLFWIISFWAVYFPLSAYKYFLDPHSKDLTKFWNLIKSTVSIGIITSAILLLFFYDFVHRILLNNYQDMYSAYKNKSGWASFMEMVDFFGYFPLVLFGIGIYFGMKDQRLKYFSILLLSHAILTFLLFNRIQDFGIHHNFLFTGSLLIGQGFGVFVILEMVEKKYADYYDTSYFTLCIAYLFLFVCYFNPALDPLSTKLGGLFGKYRYSYPIRRNDYLTIHQIVRDLNELVGSNKKKVYVLSSSYLLNDDMLKHSLLPETSDAIPSLLDTKDIDKRDGFPNDLFWNANYILVVNPVQLHVNVAGQQVVAYFANTVLDPERLGKYFKEVRRYKLGNGIGEEAILLQKTRPISVQEVERTAHDFKNLYPDYPMLHLQDPFRATSFVELGDGNSLVVGLQDGSKEIFVHPGATTSTVFALGLEKQKQSVSFELMHQDPEAIKKIENPKENAEIGFKVFVDGQEVAADTVTWEGSKTYQIDVTNKDVITFEINKGRYTDGYDGFYMKNFQLK